jgi:CMP-N-acetylneuraminic acid synthetase
VEKAIKMMLEAGQAPTGLRSVHRMTESAFKSFTLRNSLLQPVTREGFDQSDKPDQEVEATYKPNGYVDIILPATVAAGSCFGDTVIPLVTPPVIELDEQEDWDYLTYLLKSRNAGEAHEFYREGGPLKTSYGI